MQVRARSRLRTRHAMGVGCVALVAALGAGCAQPKETATTSSSLPPGNPVANGQLSTTLPTAAVPTTPAVARNPVCAASDLWGIAIIKATDPASRAGATPAEITASLTSTAGVVKAQVPANATDIDTRTQLAQKVLDGGALTEAEKTAQKDATDRLDAWYKTTCPSA